MDKVKNLIKKIAAPVQKALDKVVGWLIEKGKALVGKMFGKKGDKKVEGKKGDLISVGREIVTLGEEKNQDGEITKEEAELIASKVSLDQSEAVKSVSVKDGGEIWKFNYVQRVTSDKEVDIPKNTKPRKITQAKWGKVIEDYGTTAMEHIRDGHFYNSRPGEKSSRFYQSNSSASKIKALVDLAILNGTHSGSGKNYKVVYSFSDFIGTDSQERKSKKLLVYLDDQGNVKNAYPI